MADIEYQPCIVSFIDVLGFRDLIRKRSAAEVFEVIQKFQKFSMPEQEHEPGSAGNADQTMEPYAYTMSDATIRVRPYAAQSRYGAFFWELYDLMFVQMNIVGNGVLIRAGVAVGDAFAGLNGEGPIFGPAMNRAYEVESKEAIYPRIVIDDDAMSTFKNDELLRQADSTVEFEMESVEELLETDDDGKRFIDYLGAGRSEFEFPIAYLEFLTRHRELAKDGLAGSPKHVKHKYQWLAQYHNKHVSKLLDEVSKSDELEEQLYEDGLEVDAETTIEGLLVSI